MLNENDLNRYARQVIIPNFDEEGQEKLLSTKCLIVGAGGLGCPVALYASAAGFGSIEIWDDDCVEITNLNRQIAHDNNRIGLNKAISLAEACLRLNPNILVMPKVKKLDASSNIKEFDLIFDCSDNPKTKYKSAISRRNWVIDKMYNNKLINQIDLRYKDSIFRCR